MPGAWYGSVGAGLVIVTEEWLLSDVQVRNPGLGREDYEFQMLLGVDEQLRKILLDAGHRMRVYVPYGRNWYAYSVRRLKENPSIARHALLQMLRKPQ